MARLHGLWAWPVFRSLAQGQEAHEITCNPPTVLSYTQNRVSLHECEERTVLISARCAQINLTATRNLLCMPSSCPS